MTTDKDNKNIFDNIGSYVVNHWSFFVSIISVLTLLIGCLVYNVSPIHTIREISIKQHQENLKNDFIEYHNDLGTQFLKLEQYDAARSEFKQVLEVDPLNQQARTGLRECEVFKDISNTSSDPEITKMELDEMMNENTSSPLIYLYLGDFALRIGDQKTALAYYQKSIDLDNTVADAYFNMGRIYDQQNQTDKAMEYYNKALNLSNMDLKFINGIAYLYYEKKDYPKAIKLYNYIYLLDSKYLLPYYSYSNSYRLLGNLNSALRYQELLIELLDDNNITNLEINKDHGWYLYANSKKSIYLENDPERKYYAYYSIALTYYLLGDEKKTIEYVKRANDLHIAKHLESDAKELIDFDIKNLQVEQPNFKNKTADFKNRFLE